MTFEKLADRVDDELLTATCLNALSQNVEHAFGMTQGMNVGFQTYVGDVSDLTGSDVIWMIRHKLDYFHYNIVVDADLDDIYIKALLVDNSGSTITLYSNASPGSTHTFSGYVDVSSLLSASNWYKVWVEIDYSDGETHATYVYDLYESDATSLGTSTESSYAAPQRWSHGDTVSAANMNKYKTALDAAYSRSGDEQYIQLVRQNNTPDGASGYRGGYFFVHRQRWLHFVGDQVEIVDPILGNDTQEETTSPVDLYTVDWLAEGMLYEVKDCVFCTEDSDP